MISHRTLVKRSVIFVAKFLCRGRQSYSKDYVYKMNNCVCFSSHTHRAAELCAAVAHCACAVALHVISIHFCRLITDLNINVNACYSQILIAINPSEFRAS